MSTNSVFTSRIRDPRAVYCSPVKGDSTSALQDAIYLVSNRLGEGIVFLEEGDYLLSSTIYIPTGVRLIGWGKKRPRLVLQDNAPALMQVAPGDKGDASYLLWFVGRAPVPGRPIMDANAGTFYSALQNVDIDMGHGNCNAVAIRSHYAQHSFISQVSIDIRDAKAGIFDTGNCIDHVEFIGGDYSIYTTKSSPAWQFSMVECDFTGARKAGILTREAGLTFIGCTFQNMPVAIETWEGFAEKLYGEYSAFSDIGDACIVMDCEGSSYSHYHLEHCLLRHVPLIARNADATSVFEACGDDVLLKDFTHGYTMEKTAAHPEMKVNLVQKSTTRRSISLKASLPELPPVDTWANAADYGVIGDRKTDVTLALQKLIDEHPVVYLPQGRYLISAPITLGKNSVLIGLHPIMTQIEISDNTQAFSGIGAPVVMVTTPAGGTNILSGIGINAGGKNNRAVGLKWQSDENSLLNDCKFVGGHGSITPDGGREGAYNASHTADLDESRKWDSMYPSLWVKGGGGTFYDIWSAAPYASCGILVDETDIPGRMIEVSVEHHVRGEVKFRKVSNWDIYCLQLEEEVCESSYCQPLEIIECENMKFANFYTFRVIWLLNPWKYSTLLWNSRNITFFGFHNFTQVKLTMDHSLYDMTHNLEVRPWELGKLTISGKESKKRYIPGEIASEFEFIDGMCVDSKQNVYFADGHRKRVYQWNAEEDICKLIIDLPFKPLSLAVDTEDRLLIVAEYFPQRGMMVDGRPERYPVPEDSREVDYGKWYGMLGNDIRVFSVDPEHPMETMEELKTADMASLTPEVIWYPANRWRNTNDWLAITSKKPEQVFVALDGKTVIPDIWDLIRANSLAPAYPGKTFYCLDEYYRRTYAFEVDEKGYLTSPEIFRENGEQGIAVTEEAVAIAEGDIQLYDREGKLFAEIPTALRPAALAFAKGWIYAAARSSLLRFPLEK